MHVFHILMEKEKHVKLNIYCFFSFTSMTVSTICAVHLTEGEEKHTLNVTQGF